ncbi:MAG: outer membrane beta-barrel protein [Gammaproteobacteria bacterium]|nr:outer membrane beta-barrel protein [Gammaproteobacteria bacterium]MBU0788064.1 outer membrane beta-barrel protein [Gammaproteobacteria bacterium]MBU0815438.1 outer membrane beta-barrel protein [Gammaproteobacteria bacterium]MBU1785454.1 outer membrane beta-barrel protein [Gammaproteobacteria bacterium]
MNTSHKTLLSAALLVCAVGATSGAWAQTKPAESFIGPAFGVSIYAQQTSVDYTSTFAPIGNRSSSGNGSEVSVIGSWGFALAPEWVGTVGLSLGTQTLDGGSFNYTSGGTQTITTKLKDHWSISFAPGYRVGADSLVYAKLAYHQITGVYTDTLTKGGTTTHTGTGWGLGYAFAVSRQLELRAEYEAVSYSSGKVLLTEGKPEQKGVSFSALYRF